MNDVGRVRKWARLAQSLILELREKSPEHSTFSQVGLLDGAETVEEYLKYGELGCAVHHLLYMIHESDIRYPKEDVLALHDIAERIGENNYYTRANQENLSEELRQYCYNIPE